MATFRDYLVGQPPALGSFALATNAGGGFDLTSSRPRPDG